MQGHVQDERVPLNWDEKTNVLWKTELPGDGHSSPILLDGRVYLTGSTNKGKDFHVFCVDAVKGTLLWKQTAATNQPQERTHAWHGYASPSCATDGKYVYAFFGSPGLYCYTVDGKPVWEKKFGTFTSKAGWGTAASPFLYGNSVIVNCDNDGGAGAAPAALVALDKATGKELWSTPRDQGRGFSTPMLMKTATGRTDLLLNGPEGLWGYDPATGKEQWRITRSHPDDQHQFGEPLPVSDGQNMFILSGRTGPWQIVRMPDKGDCTKTHVLHTAIRGKRDVASPILVEGRAYCVDKGSQLTVFDIKSGKKTAQMDLKRGANSMASPIYVRGKLLWTLGDGTTVVVEPGDTPKIVARNRLPGESLDYGASPAVVDGRLYIRSRNTLWCIGEK
jgi:outer membrane protein assembly factor BamB